MVAPVVGPFVSNVNVAAPGNNVFAYSSQRRRWRQSAPYNLVLPYEAYNFSGSYRGNTALIALPEHCGSQDSLSYRWSQGFYSRTMSYVTSRCYDKLKDKAYSSAGLGVDFAEAHQSIRMMEQRGIQMVSFLRRLRKLDFVGAARVIGLTRVPPKVSARKRLASNFLEFHFGWEPLVKDVFASIDVLQHPFKDVEVRSSDSSQFSRKTLNDTGGGFVGKSLEVSNVRCRMGMAFSVTNPNLHLADQLGLVNPLSIAEELVPFSFVADWFVNVSQVIGSLTDFLGLTVTRSYTVQSVVVYLEASQTNPFQSPPFASGQVNGTIVFRNSGVSPPTLVVRPWKLPSVTRAATAWALVTQLLK